MATAAKKVEVLPAEDAGTDIVVAVNANPGIVLLDREKYSVWYEARLAEGKAIPADVSVKKNRDALRSFAADVRSDKAGIKKARLRLTEEWRTMTAQANAAGKEIDEQLESLAVEIRQPLTDWEAAEEAREEAAKALIAGIWAACEISIDDTADDVMTRGTDVWNTKLDPELLGARLDEATSAKSIAVERLKTALARLKKEEADRAELEKLRAAEAERARAEEEKAAAAEIERQRIEAERLAEECRIAAEKADADRIAAAEQAAADKAAKEAQDAADAERDRIAREHEAELNAERDARLKVEREARAGREMLAYIREVVAGRIGGQVQPFGVLLRELESKVVIVGQGYGDMEAEIEQARVDGLASLNAAMERQAAQRKAEEDRIAEQERQQNKANRAAKKTAAKQAIMTCGASEETAQKIVLAIIAGEIPAVTLAF